MQEKSDMLFALLRSAISGKPLEEARRARFTPEQLPWLLSASQKHDLAHLVALGLQKNGLVNKTEESWQPFAQALRGAVFRAERVSRTLEGLCRLLEQEKLPFIPLKGAVIREKYPEPWMRTSSDIDVLVHPRDLERALACMQAAGYTEETRGGHDVGLRGPGELRVELHFDLVEDYEANNAARVLRSVWEHAAPCRGWEYRYGMDPDFYYFYHIAHMAKHFAAGGCGIRTFLDIWVLMCAGPEWTSAQALLEKAGLERFAGHCCQLARAWFGGSQPEEAAEKMARFILRGGVFGSSENRVAVQQQSHGGRTGYLLSRVFAPREKLCGYFPVLKRHPWLLPVMQVRRWLWLLRPGVARMARGELEANREINQEQAAHMHGFLREMGL